MKINYSKKLLRLPPYLFAEIDRKKKEALKKGVDIINLGVGDPDLAPPSHIRKKLKEAVDRPENWSYPFGEGLMEFREAVARWYRYRFNVDLDPASEVHCLIGSKEGIAHLPIAFINPSDIVLCPEPGYPVYGGGTIFAEGEPYFMPLLSANGFLPVLDAIPQDVARRAKLLFINYPNNPTGACAGRDFFERVIDFARKHNLIVAHDAAYTELYYTENKPISFLSLPGAKDVGIEFHSLSKTYNMTGWRIGWVCGNAGVIKGISRVEENIDSGTFNAVQAAAIEALDGPQDCTDRVRRTYAERLGILSEGLARLGWKFKTPEATFYLWARTMDGYSSVECVGKVLDEAGIIVTPGNGFGSSGEGYVRFSLTVSSERIEEALERLGRIRW